MRTYSDCQLVLYPVMACDVASILRREATIIRVSQTLCRENSACESEHFDF